MPCFSNSILSGRCSFAVGEMGKEIGVLEFRGILFRLNVDVFDCLAAMKGTQMYSLDDDVEDREPDEVRYDW